MNNGNFQLFQTYELESHEAGVYVLCKANYLKKDVRIIMIFHW